MNRTTTRLNLSLRDRWIMHEAAIRHMAIGGMFVVTLLLIHSLLSPAPAPAPAPVMVQQLRPAILVMTATAAPPLPTATPWPTPEPQVIIQQAEPQVVYVPVEAQPTMPPETGDNITRLPPPPPPDAPQQSGPGGSGKATAPDFGTIPSASSDSAAQWCAGAAASGVARCTGR